MGDVFRQSVDRTVKEVIDLTVVGQAETCFNHLCNNIQNNTTLFTIGNNRGPSLGATETLSVSQLPSYPASSLGGIAYVVPITMTEEGRIPTKGQVLKQATSVGTYRQASTATLVANSLILK